MTSGELEQLKRECEYHEEPDTVAAEWEIEEETLGSVDSLIAYKDALEDRLLSIEAS